MSCAYGGQPPNFASGVHYGNAGIGILGSVITAASGIGDSGPGPLINDSLDPTKEYLWYISTWPPTGILMAYEDGTFTYSNPTDGTYLIPYRLVEDGVLLGTGDSYIIATIGAGGSITLVGSNSTQANNSSALAIGLTPNGLVLVGSNSTQANNSSAGVIGLTANNLNLVGSNSTQSNNSTSGIIGLAPAAIVLVGSDSTQSNASGAGAISLAPGALILVGSNCVQANDSTALAIDLAAAIMLQGTNCVQINESSAAAVGLTLGGLPAQPSAARQVQVTATGLVYARGTVFAIPGIPVFVKDPDATLDYSANWAAWLADAGEPLVGAEVLLPEGSTLIKVADGMLGEVQVAILAGGTPGVANPFTFRIHTPTRADDRTVILQIQEN